MPGLFERLTVGDSRVCEDCIALEATPPMTFKQWQSSGLMPRVASTACDGRCRCTLVIVDEVAAEVERLINEAVDEGLDGSIHVDLAVGKRVLLKDFDQIKGMWTVPLEKISEMEQLIWNWKRQNNFVALPDTFWQLLDIRKMIPWLEKRI